MKNTSTRSAGQGFLEYALIISLIPIAVFLVLNLTGVSLRDVYCSVIGIFGSKACNASYFADEFDSLDQWQVINGNWKNIDGQLCNERGGLIFSDIPQSGDYQINLKGANLSKGNGFGVLFRSSNYNKDNSYIFQYDSGFGSGEMIYRERANGREFSPSARYKPGGDFDWYNESHDISIKVEGDTFTAYVDSEQVLQTQDATWAEGGIGLRTWNATDVCFDSISVDPLP